MGVVYRARYVGNDRIVAVKLLPSESDANATTIARFEREMEVLKQLEHPNIVHCFGGTCEGAQRFYAMELIEGGTLAQLLRKRGRLNWYVAVDYAIQMCEALQYAHDRGVIHRDLKPGNFLLTKQGQIKLSDFGLVTVAAGRRLTATGRTIGTVEYMSPEQIRGKPPATNRSDLYSLGCVIYEMLTGNPPYVGESHIEVMQKHLREPIPHVVRADSEIPLELDELLYELLSKTVEGRPESARIVGQRLSAILQPGRRMHKYETKLIPVPKTAQSKLPQVEGIQNSESDSELDVQDVPVRSRWDWVVLACLLIVCFFSVKGWIQSSFRAAQYQRALFAQIDSSDSHSQVGAVRTLSMIKRLGPKAVNKLNQVTKSGSDELRMAALNALSTHADECGHLQWEIYKLQQTESVSPTVRYMAQQTVDAIIQARSRSTFWSISSVLSFLAFVSAIGIAGAWIWRQFFVAEKLPTPSFKTSSTSV